MNKLSKSDVSSRAFQVFSDDFATPPQVSLRSGNEIDSYAKPLPFDENEDKPTDEYVEKFSWGIVHLDPASWRHYLPILIDLSIRKIDGASNIAVDAFLSSLRPPDRDPPRFATLSAEQIQVITDFLDIMAFDEQSAYREEAMAAIQEFWGPGASSP